MVTVDEADRLAALLRAGLVHPRAEAVTAPLFSSGGFSWLRGQVQVIRARCCGRTWPSTCRSRWPRRLTGTRVPRSTWWPPASSGPEWPGCWTSAPRPPRGPVKLRPEITEFIRWRRRPRGPCWPAGGGAVRGGAAPPRAIATGARAAVSTPRCSAGRRAGRGAQADYELLRGCVLRDGWLPPGLAAARFARRGLAGLIAWPAAEPVFRAELAAAARQAWTPGAAAPRVSSRRSRRPTSSCSTPLPWRCRAASVGGLVMKAAIYARVSTERQAERGRSAPRSREALRGHVAAAGDALAAEYCDDRHSGARLDRPGLDALRDAAEAGLFEVVYCLSPDRLARSYAYQVLILDELARLGALVRFTDAPGLDQDDPQARLLTQVPGRDRRIRAGQGPANGTGGASCSGSRAGEVPCPQGPLRLPAHPPQPGRPRAPGDLRTRGRRGAADFAARATGTTIRQICRQLNADAGAHSHRPPRRVGHLHGEPAAARRGLHRPGLLHPHRDRPGPRPGRRSRQVPRPRDQRIAIPCPRPSSPKRHRGRRPGQLRQRQVEPAPRRTRRLAAAPPGQVRALRGGHQLPQMRGRNGTWHRYYYCHNHDPVRAGGQDRRCPERNIHADALDAFVFGQIRAALLDTCPCCWPASRPSRSARSGPRRPAARRRAGPPGPQAPGRHAASATGRSISTRPG